MLPWERVMRNPELVQLILELFFSQERSRDDLPYTEEFNGILMGFNSEMTFRMNGWEKCVMDSRDLWLCLIKLGKRELLARGTREEKERRKRMGRGFF